MYQKGLFMKQAVVSKRVIFEPDDWQILIVRYHSRLQEETRAL
jgi:hypothetical protein